MEPKIETHNNPESVDKTNNKANLNNQQVSQTKNRTIFSKGKVGKNLNYKTLYERVPYFEQYDGLKDVDDSNKKAILNILSEDYKNMTSEEKSHVPESFLKTLEDMGKSARNGQVQSASLDKIPIETSSLRSPLGAATGAEIVDQVEIKGQSHKSIKIVCRISWSTIFPFMTLPSIFTHVISTILLVVVIPKSSPFCL